MANNEANAARVRKWVKVWDGRRNVVCECILLDDGELERLATWFHEHECYDKITECSDKGLRKAKRQAARRGYCDDCRDYAASLLSTCPYLHMSRPDQQVFSDEGMEWRPRSAESPKNKAPVAINERRRRLMGC
jgi:hypothetical protein